MKRTKTVLVVGAFAVAGTGALFLSSTLNTASAHCDTMKGPVIPEAQAALATGDVTPILKWVRQENEAEIRAAFARAVAVRAMGSEARELADRYFVETLVRIHRAGEGAPYNGLKDEPIEPIVVMADQALADGNADEMIAKISGHMAAAIREKFDKALEAEKGKDKSVEAGREFVEAYVTYMHFVEGIHTAIVSSPGHHQESGQDGGSGHDGHRTRGH